MRYAKILCTFILAFSLLGCHSDKKVDAPSPQAKQESTRQRRPSMKSSFEARFDISLLPEVIKSASQKLGLALEQADMKPGRYIYTGKTPAGIDVNIEAIALVKDRSLIILTVTGERGDNAILNPLRQAILNALRTAARNREQ